MRIIKLVLCLATMLPITLLLAQPKLEFNLKKPTKFKEKKLPSERMADHKLTRLRRFFQNTYTHYNYFFNANQKLNEIVEESKSQFKDDYTQLLPYYPYSLEQTSQSGFLDSVLQKCTAGILLHDLRNDWIDNMYLIMGKAYLLRKNFDSAAMTFQFINHTFSPKEKDGYDKLIGSNAEEGGSALSVATKEKKGNFAYMLSRPPSRNEAFVWQIRTLIEDSNYVDASSLIETLQNDAVFPARLKEELSDAKAYLYYKMESWDSAATYLEKAVSLAANRNEKARSWFLIAQLYQLTNNYKQASLAYNKCTDYTLDPVMEVYARLNTIRLNKSNNPKIIDENVASLVSMAKKDKYQNYRDIIYYAAALFEMERDGFDAAKTFLQKSIKHSTTDQAQRNRSFMLLGDIMFTQKQFGNAAIWGYDSTSASELKSKDSARLELRKPATHQIALAEQVIYLQDSLLRLAAMNEPKRLDFVKKIAREQRKLKGLKEEPTTGSTNQNINNPAAQTATAANLFTTASANWYFYDVNSRAAGFTKFKDRWGGRPSVDNWRRSAAIKANNNSQKNDTNTDFDKTKTNSVSDEAFDTTDLSFDNLYSRIPLTEEKNLKTNDRITNALFTKGTVLHEQLEEYTEAIKIFEDVVKRSGDSGKLTEKSLYALVHCYSKVGDAANANRCAQLLQHKFSESELATKLQNNLSPQAEAKKQANADTYKSIYNLFIEGNFEKALAEKKIADSVSGTNYWTPQLLYIEAIYHIKQREDSLATFTLNNIASKFPDHVLAIKAQKMTEVLLRRKQIEEYLTKLNITRLPEDSLIIPSTASVSNVLYPVSNTKIDSAFKTITLPAKNDSTATTLINGSNNKKDSISNGNNTFVITKASTPSPYTFQVNEPGFVGIILEKIDPAYVNEVMYSINVSNKKNYNGNTVTATKRKLKDNLWLVILKCDAFTNTGSLIDYINYFKPVAKKEILSWLDTTKYQYTILNEVNYNLLLQDPNMVLYQKVIQETFIGSF